MTIQYSARFKRSFKKLDKQVQLTAWKKLETFKVDHFDPKLKVHKLQNAEYYSFSVNYKVRIIFLIVDCTIILMNIGDHSLYQKL